ncbi:alpha/beta hydrolase family protein [Leptospira broomii serovar Hurstbridge str. 5399]|uniref:Alpha/beta hydrolase family protein n=1 Tax=Leptospira broomii serovar Hurstbridge str. 5399 TaxID=1049789 RepID=T0F599_9LEPT|nr:alpha/beta hydrolase [Leptospira broomii]EQA46300.1 alpha/beta hydrolase family protein [Leptospira broomii serovar Hurstbridge str. 5399]
MLTEYIRCSDGTDIAYTEIGKGDPLILVDGAFCSRSFGPMRKLAELLSSRFKVIYYDRRGRGDSSNTLPYSVDREVEDLNALIQLAGGSAFLFGISSGGVLCLRAAAAGLSIKKLAIYEPPFMLDEDSAQSLSEHEENLNNLVAADRRSDTAKYFLTKVMGMPYIFTFVMRLMPHWEKMKSVANTLPYDVAIINDGSLSFEQIGSIRILALVSAGEKSPLVLRRAAEKVEQLLPTSEYKSLAKQTHNVSTKALAPMLEEFFAR